MATCIGGEQGDAATRAEGELVTGIWDFEYVSFVIGLFLAKKKREL